MPLSSLAHLVRVFLACFYFAAWAVAFAWLGWRAFGVPLREMMRGEERGFEVVQVKGKGNEAA